MKLGRLLTFTTLFLTPSGAVWAQPVALAPLRAAGAASQAPTRSIVESPNVRVLTGLYAQQFQEEMNLIVQGLGVTCNTCHVRNNFASEEKPEKLKARQMLEMTKGLNEKHFPGYIPKEGESVLGKVTCYTCHKGETTPKNSVAQ